MPPTIPAIAYLIGLALAFELSLGSYGLLYPWLYEHVGVFRGLRAPARASAFFLLFLGVLAAYGTAALTAAMTTRKRRAAAALICTILLIEVRVSSLPLVAYHNEPPPLYKVLATLPRGVVAEFPMARLDWANLPKRRGPFSRRCGTFANGCSATGSPRNCWAIYRWG